MRQACDVAIRVCVCVQSFILISLHSYFQPGVVDKDGRTPLRLAVKNGKLEVVNYLIVEQNVGLKGRCEQLSIEE